MFQEDMYQKLKKDWVYKMSIKKQLLIRGLIGAAGGVFFFLLKKYRLRFSRFILIFFIFSQLAPQITTYCIKSSA